MDRARQAETQGAEGQEPLKIDTSRAVSSPFGGFEAVEPARVDWHWIIASSPATVGFVLEFVFSVPGKFLPSGYFGHCLELIIGCKCKPPPQLLTSRERQAHIQGGFHTKPSEAKGRFAMGRM